MIDSKRVQLWLRAHLLAMSGLPAVIEYENKLTSGRPDKVMWLRETFLPGGEQLIGWKTLQMVGVYQISAFGPLDSGLDAVVLADAIKDHFRPGRPGGVSGGVGGFVSIERAERGRGIPEDLWYSVPVSIFWRVGPRLADAETPAPPP